jgi:TnpA family transposase
MVEESGTNRVRRSIGSIWRIETLPGSPRLADLGDAKLWRIDRKADYGPFDSLGKATINLGLIRDNWADVIRLAGSRAWCMDPAVAAGTGAA